ncbi:MAG: hypothetical protein AAFR28_00035 [Pseudomonadota bacterium]
MGSGNSQETADFFTSLFSWRFHSMGDGNGWFETPGGKIGLHANDPDWGAVPYFQVADLEAAMERVRDLGGETEDIAKAEGFGRFSNCKDSQGMRFGLHEP